MRREQGYFSNAWLQSLQRANCGVRALPMFACECAYKKLIVLNNTKLNTTQSRPLRVYSKFPQIIVCDLFNFRYQTLINIDTNYSINEENKRFGTKPFNQ